MRTSTQTGTIVLMMTFIIREVTFKKMLIIHCLMSHLLIMEQLECSLPITTSGYHTQCIDLFLLVLLVLLAPTDHTLIKTSLLYSSIGICASNRIAACTCHYWLGTVIVVYMDNTIQITLRFCSAYKSLLGLVH